MEPKGRPREDNPLLNPPDKSMSAATSDGDFESWDRRTKRRRTALCLTFAVVVLAIATAVGLLLHFYLPRDVPTARSAAVGDCHPDKGATEDRCEKRGCTWQRMTDGAPYCTFPPGYGYSMEGEPSSTEFGHQVTLKAGNNPPLFEDSQNIDDIIVEVEAYTETMLRIKYRDAADTRYKVPEEAVAIPRGNAPPSVDSRLYTYEFVKTPQFGVKVTRKVTGTVIFDTSVPGFTFSDQYLQITTRLPSGHLYGFGEHNHRRLKHDMNWKKWTIFTRDVAPVDEWNLYGSQPMYMNLEQDANANAVLLLNSNAMDIVLQPENYPAVSYHVIGGILDFYVFLGPTPENIVQQYTYATGRPVLPPYWALGFQLSRWDYNNLTHVRDVVQRNLDSHVPLDVQYGDIDYMNSKLDFTYDKDLYDGLPAFVDELHDQGMHYIVIQDHCISSDRDMHQEKLGGTYLPYSDGVKDGIFIHDPRNPSAFLEGEVWPGVVHFPDFTDVVNATRWWKRQCIDFYSGQNWGVKYDALWIDMNEPSNFVAGSTSSCETNLWNYPPYVPNILGAGDDGRLFDKTICMDAEQKWGKHYNVHSLYGHSMSIVSWRTLREMFPEKRPFVLTRSNFVGTQKYAVHWLGDNQSQWRQIPWSIVGMLEYSLFGFSYTGADICGFWYAATPSMCQRWMQLGAFYPFARNHNAEGWPDQDPAAFGGEVLRVSRDILLTRYRLLPFLYTLLEEAHEQGSTVARPLLHEFTSDNETWAIDRQFLWGPALLISPALEENQTVVDSYFPSTRWYDYYGGKEMEQTGVMMNLSTPMDKINLHVRGGYILPVQEPAHNTNLSRQNPMGLVIALGSEPTFDARGRLFWDDGESHECLKDRAFHIRTVYVNSLDPNGIAWRLGNPQLHNASRVVSWFVLKETRTSGKYLEVEFSCSQPISSASYVLKSEVKHNGYNATEVIWNVLDIWGLPKKPTHIQLNSRTLEDIYVKYDSAAKAVQLELGRLKMSIVTDFVISWRIIN